MFHRRKVIGVMGSGTQSYRERVVPLARWIAEHGYDLLTGAGSGVMQTAAEAFVAVVGRTGISIGIVPGRVTARGYRPRPGYPNPSIELPVFTHLPLSGSQGQAPESRNHLNVLSAQALVILPGGAGTLAEAQLAARYRRPAVLFGTAREFRSFPGAFERMASLEEVCDWLLGVTR
ncbi:molybdenum cofactor carrier protein [Stigmatella aurantiaca]|uniref:Molybdenum cofactor carrier protein n=1 Tax=Stigmatella aurantiaca (strain DW4/3-1) TaxID=378806 RepID=E3FE43_STIAD|nr:molybdenum cofactor carrier protein [Stigmatella aurantiaca]ADO72646.1 molybdenum cofactor carrier protein [Stigmatella aurantiaca DW4/3-1]